MYTHLGTHAHFGSSPFGLSGMRLWFCLSLLLVHMRERSWFVWSGATLVQICIKAHDGKSAVLSGAVMANGRSFKEKCDGQADQLRLQGGKWAVLKGSCNGKWTVL